MRINTKTLTLNKLIFILQIVFGAANTFFWGIGGIGCMFSEENRLDVFSFIIVLIFAMASGVVLYSGIKRSKMEDVLKYYQYIVGNRPLMHFSDISYVCKKSEMQIAKDCEWFIKKNFFIDAYVDYEQKAIVFKEAYDRYVWQKRREEQQKKKIVYVSLVCDCCSGITKLEKGENGTCDYCGAPIKA